MHMLQSKHLLDAGSPRLALQPHCWGRRSIYILDVDEGWTRREWGEDWRMIERNVCMWIWEREVDAHAEGGVSHQAVPSALLSLVLSSLTTVRRYSCNHFIAFDVNQLIALIAARNILSLNATGIVFRQKRALTVSPLTPGGEGAFLEKNKDWCVIPQHLLRRGNAQKVVGGEGGEGAPGRGVWSGLVVERLRLGEGGTWLCRLFGHRSCYCNVGCVSFRHSPAFLRHEPRRKSLLLHPQLLCKSSFFCLWFLIVMAALSKPLHNNLPCVACQPVRGGWGGRCVGPRTWMLQLLVNNQKWHHIRLWSSSCVMIKDTWLITLFGIELPVCWLEGRRKNVCQDCGI